MENKKMYKIDATNFISPIDFKIHLTDNNHIVVDDTLLFVKMDKNNDIDIVNISKIVSSNEKFKIYTDEGWKRVSITECDKQETTKLSKKDCVEFKNFISNKYTFNKRKLNMCAILAAGNREHALVTRDVLNCVVDGKKYFLEKFEYNKQMDKKYSEQILSSLKYIELCINGN